MTAERSARAGVACGRSRSAGQGAARRPRDMTRAAASPRRRRCTLIVARAGSARAAEPVPQTAAAGHADRGAARDDRAGDPRHHAEPVPPAPGGQARAAARPARADTRTEAGAAGAEPRTAPFGRGSTPPPPPPPPKPEAKPGPPGRRPPGRRSDTEADPAATPAEAGRSASAGRPAAGSGTQAQAETQQAASTRASKPEATRPRPSRSPRPGRPIRRRSASCSRISRRTSTKKDQPDAFDSLLKNLTKQQSARAEEPTPAPRRMASLSPPSSQPKAPLGTELTASEIDVVRQQLSRCWNIPAGARDAKELVVTIRGAIAPDGRVLQATIVDQSQARRPVFPRRGGKRAPRLLPSAMHAAAPAAGKVRSRGRRSRSS